MRAVIVALLCALCLLPVTSPAQEMGAAAGLPSRDQIRRFYADSARHWPAIPRQVRLAFVAAEDPGFFGRLPQYSSFAHDIAHRYPRATHARLQVRAAAYAIGFALSHEEILTWFLNTAYLGRGCFGVDAAAGAYFGKPAGKLTLAETAFLAALPKAPALLDPARNHDRALARRNLVLTRMRDAGFVSADAAERALGQPLATPVPLGKCEPNQ